jgi:hypothetical protein
VSVDISNVVKEKLLGAQIKEAKKKISFLRRQTIIALSE